MGDFERGTVGHGPEEKAYAVPAYLRHEASRVVPSNVGRLNFPNAAMGPSLTLILTLIIGSGQSDRWSIGQSEVKM